MDPIETVVREILACFPRLNETHGYEDVVKAAVGRIQRLLDDQEASD